MAEQTRNPTSEVSVTGAWSDSDRHLLLNDHPDSSDPIASGVTCSSPGNIQFGFSPFTIPNGSTNIVIEVSYYDFKNGSAPAAIGASIRCNDSTNRNATKHNPTEGNSNISLRTNTYTKNPKTGNKWTVNEVNGFGDAALTSFGLDCSAAGPSITISSIQLKVRYIPPGHRVVNIYIEEGEDYRTVLNEREDEDLAHVEDAEDETLLNQCCCSCASLGFPECLQCYDTQEFTSSSVVNWPSGITIATIECWGRGGKGGKSNKVKQGAGGGGGGAYSRKNRVDKTHGFLDVLVNDASNDYDTEVYQDVALECRAQAGSDGQDSPNGHGGVGGIRSECIGDVIFPGGNGANGVDVSGGVIGYGGGGGGGAGSSQAGTGAYRFFGGIGGKEDGGRGGQGESVHSVSNKHGQDYGGGGAGGYNNHIGGNPGKGLVRIHWWTGEKKSITLEVFDLVDNSYFCNCTTEISEFYGVDCLWSNLNGTYVLDQVGGTFFLLTIISSTDGEEIHNAEGAVLVKKTVNGECDDEGNPYFVSEREWRLTHIQLLLDCREPGEMYIASVGFILARIVRTWFRHTGTWTPWSFVVQEDFPICDMGEILQTATACQQGTYMRRKILVPDTTVQGPGCPNLWIVDSCQHPNVTFTEAEVAARLNTCDSGS